MYHLPFLFLKKLLTHFVLGHILNIEKEDGSYMDSINKNPQNVYTAMDEMVTRQYEKIIARIAENKAMQNGDLTKRINELEKQYFNNQNIIMNKLVELEKQQNIYLVLADRLEVLTDKVDRLFSEKTEVTTTSEKTEVITTVEEKKAADKSVLDSIKEYVAIGKVTGQVIEVMAGSADLIIDTIKSSNSETSAVAVTSSQSSQGNQEKEQDYSGIIQSLTDLVRGISTTLKSAKS